MLPRQQRRRHHERDLQSVHCRDERGTNGDFGLAETDVAADEAVHGLARRQIGKHGVDARRLIFRLFVREARDELVKGPSGRYQHGRFPHRPKRRDLDQLVGDLAQTLLELCLAGLPADAAEPVELRISLIRAVARQKLDVLDGQKQLVAAGVVKLETIVRGAKRRDRLQARKPPDTVVAVDDEIADRKARRFRQDISGLASAPPLPHQAVAKHVLLRDDGEVRRLETFFDSKYGKGRLARSQREHIGEALDFRGILETVILQKRDQPFARTGRPGREKHPPVLGMNASDMSDDRVEHIVIGIGALGRERAAALSVHRVDVRRARIVERRQSRDRPRAERRPPVFAVEKHLVRRHGFVGRGAETLAFEGIDARLIVLADLLEPLLDRLVRVVIEADPDTRQIIEQRLEARMEERQPMLLADVTPAAADRLIKRIIARIAAEQRDVARPEQRRRRFTERDFAHRHQRKFRHGLQRALRLGVERLDALELIAEKVEPYRIAASRRIKIEDAATLRVFAGLHHGTRPVVAVGFETLDEIGRVETLSGRNRPDGATNEATRRDALQNGIDRRQHQSRLLAAADRELSERHDPPRYDLRVRARPVVRNRIPRGKRHDCDVGREESNRRLQFVEPTVIARHMKMQTRLIAGAGRLRDIGNDPAVKSLRDA